MISSRSKSSEKACPVCNTEIADQFKLDQARKTLEIELDRRIRDATRRQTEEYRLMLRQVKERHRAEYRELRVATQKDQKDAKSKLAETSKKEKAAHNAALAKLRRDHQEQLRDLRDSYERENLRMQKEHEGSFNLQLQEIIRNYGTLASAHQKEQERLKKAHDEADVLLRKKDSEIFRLKVELAKSLSKVEIKDLVLKLRERDDTIDRLNSRIEELEGRITAPPPPAEQQAPKTLTEDEQKEKLKEYMRAIIEITRSQRAERKKADGLSGLDDAKPDIPESKVDKKLGWFF
jgi:hypothetical protein